METKKTAIDYLEEQLWSNQYLVSIGKISLYQFDELLKEHFKIAKKFEEEQMKNSFNYGIGLDGLIDDCSAIFIRYYEETYGSI